MGEVINTSHKGLGKYLGAALTKRVKDLDDKNYMISKKEKEDDIRWQKDLP